jgi:hypothetical protein
MEQRIQKTAPDARTNQSAKSGLQFLPVMSHDSPMLRQLAILLMATACLAGGSSKSGPMKLLMHDTWNSGRSAGLSKGAIHHPASDSGPKISLRKKMQELNEASQHTLEVPAAGKKAPRGVASRRYFISSKLNGAKGHKH